jgi:hypothetical protein
MNDLVLQQLAIATDAWCDQNLPGDWSVNLPAYLATWEGKFAELIVRECAKVAIDNGCGDFVDIKQKLFENFGVKE